MLGKRIAIARSNDAKNIDAFKTQSQKLIEERMQYYWIPRLIKEMMKGKNDDGLTFDKAVCKNKGALDRAVEVQSFIMAVSGVVQKRFRKYNRALRKEMRTLRAVHRTEYDDLERMNTALSENLNATMKDQKRRDAVLKAWDLPTDVATPVNAAAERLNKLFEEE